MKLRPILKDISLTYVTQAIVMVAFFVIFRLIARNFGPEGVGEYSLVKRAVALLISLLLLGLGMGLPRFIAMSQSRQERAAYMKLTALAIILTVFFLILMNLYKDFFAKLFFGSIQYANLILPLSLLLAGFTLHSIVYSYLRGRLLVKAFNFLDVINLAIIPLVILVLCKNINIAQLIALSGVATCASSILFFLPFTNELFMHVEKSQFKSSSKKLLYYSLPRIPSGFILAGFFSAGPIIAAHFASTKEAGYISVSQRMLNIVVTAVTPLGLILLPKFSSMIAQKRHNEIKQSLNILIGAAIQLSLFVSFQLMIFADVIIDYWLGPEFVDVVPIMLIASCSIFCYTFFRTVESTLDATRAKPINAINLCISFLAFLAIAGLLLFIITMFSPIISLTIAFTIGLIILGVLTHISIRKLYPDVSRQDIKYFLTALIVNAVIVAITLIIKPFIVMRAYRVITFEILILVLYLSILFLLKMNWIEKFTKKVFINRVDQ